MSREVIPRHEELPIVIGASNDAEVQAAGDSLQAKFLFGAIALGGAGILWTHNMKTLAVATGVGGLLLTASAVNSFDLRGM